MYRPVLPGRQSPCKYLRRKEVVVSTHPFKPKGFLVRCINQYPIGFDMAITRRYPCPTQGMVVLFPGKRNTLGEKPNHFT